MRGEGAAAVGLLGWELAGCCSAAKRGSMSFLTADVVLRWGAEKQRSRVEPYGNAYVTYTTV